VYGLDSAGTYKAVLFFERENGTPIRAYTTDWWVRSVDISDDGKYIVAGSKDKRVYFFSQASPQPLWSYTTSSWVNSVAMSADGSYVVTGGGEPQEEKPVCGDGICEKDKGETYENCPQDCVPEGKVKPDENKSASQPEATDQTPAPPASTSPFYELRISVLGEP